LLGLGFAWAYKGGFVDPYETDSGAKSCAFAEDDFAERGNRKSPGVASSVLKYALTTAPESDPDVLRRKTGPDPGGLSRARQSESGAKGTKKRR